jgi:RNAse (barnase) inhibitor barstar
MKAVVIDWATLKDVDDFYDAVLPQTDAPSWHGHNLDAIQDCWVTGGICPGGPPFRFVFHQAKEMNADLRSFSEIVEQIAKQSVETHGGKIVRR